VASFGFASELTNLTCLSAAGQEIDFLLNSFALSAVLTDDTSTLLAMLMQLHIEATSSSLLSDSVTTLLDHPVSITWVVLLHHLSGLRP